MTDSKTLEKMHTMAIESRTHSHSPYSKYKVGASVRLSSGEIFGGCNVENASYGGTICAERVAILKAVSEKGLVQIEDVVVVVDEKEAWPPCGMCRQVIAEFATDKTRIHVGNLQGLQKTYTFDEILPAAFRPAHLKQTKN